MGIESDALARVLAPQVMLWLELLKVERSDNKYFLVSGHQRLHVFSSISIENEALARVLAPRVMFWLEF